jgi:ParB family chromosome partitioning protein
MGWNAGVKMITELPQTIQTVPVAQCYGNPAQPRKVFDAVALSELSESIKTSGLAQPITVVSRPCDKGTFMVVMGERRLRATALAGLETITAIVRDIDDSTVKELALIENLLRRDLNDMEEARAYGAMIADGHTQKSLAKLLGHADVSRVRDRLALLNLDPSLQDGISKGAVTFTQGLEMSRLSTEGQFMLWRAIQDGRCPTPGKLRRLAGALYDMENQIEMFAQKPLTEAEKRSLGKVDQFMLDAGRLLESINGDDIAALETAPKSDAGVCIEKLLLLAKTCNTIANALQTNQARQEAVTIQ